MKKAVKIISLIILIPLIILNIYSAVIFTLYSIPKEMKNESVCFFIPELTWNSTFSDVKKQFGKPVEAGQYNDVNGTVENTYKTEYSSHPMTVYASTSAFRITELFHKRRVFDYAFCIECKDEKDSAAVFNELCEGTTKQFVSNKNFTSEIDGDDVYYTVSYGPCSVSYNIWYDKNDGENNVRMYVRALY